MRHVPDRSTTLPRRVPLFPLPQSVLLPEFPTPYQVFEPRYLALVHDLMRRPPSERWIAVPRLRDGEDAEGSASPRFHDVASVGLLVDCEKKGDGQWQVLVLGVGRARLAEIRSDLPYRMAAVTPYRDAARREVLAPSLDRLYQTLLESLTRLGDAAETLARLVEDTSDPDRMMFRLGAVLLSDPDERQAFLETRSLRVRTDIVLEALSGLLAMVASADEEEAVLA